MKLWDEGMNTIYGGKGRMKSKTKEIKEIIAIVHCDFEY
jgi:hypothetical protein